MSGLAVNNWCQHRTLRTKNLLIRPRSSLCSLEGRYLSLANKPLYSWFLWKVWLKWQYQRSFNICISSRRSLFSFRAILFLFPCLLLKKEICDQTTCGVLIYNVLAAGVLRLEHPNITCRVRWNSDARPLPQNFRVIGPAWGRRICLPAQLPADAGAAGAGRTLETSVLAYSFYCSKTDSRWRHLCFFSLSRVTHLSTSLCVLILINGKGI